MEPDDIVARSEALDEQLAVVKASSVLSTRTALKFFGVLAALLIAILAGVVGITLNTNAAVKDRAVLERRNAELEKKVAVDEDLLNQSTDAIVLLIQTLRDHGITAPEIVIRPKDEGG